MLIVPLADVPCLRRLSDHVSSPRIASGAHDRFSDARQGYRGEGVFDNFWKLIERWRVTFVITVPTALAALMQRPVDADISSLKHRDSRARRRVAGRALQPVPFGHRA